MIALSIASLMVVLCSGAGIVWTQQKQIRLLKEMIDLLAAESAGRVSPGTAYKEIVEEVP